MSGAHGHRLSSFGERKEVFWTGGAPSPDGWVARHVWPQAIVVRTASGDFGRRRDRIAEVRIAGSRAGAAMFVEIRGIMCSNKGAELMLAAIVQRLGATRPDVELAVPTWIGSYVERARYGLHQIFDPRRTSRLGFLVERLVHAGYRRRFGLVAPGEPRAVLDASGFAVGDQWPVEWIAAQAEEFRWRKAQGQAIVLLPQAFGPFEKPDVAAAARAVLETADLVFARDDASRAHVEALVPGLKSLRQARDFTNLLTPKPADHVRLGARPAAITPNQKVLKHGGDAARETYLGFLARMAETLRGEGLSPFALVHEADADYALAETLAERAGLDIVAESDPLVLKGVAARCELVVGSRYHGLVNALSQGVPALGTSWSHKYAALFGDYERPQWLADPAAPDAAEAAIRAILADRDAERAHLLARGTVLKRESEMMWAEVERLLEAAG